MTRTGDPGSMLELYRELIALRAELAGDVELLEAGDSVVAFRRGAHVVAVNTSPTSVRMPVEGTVLLSTHPGRGDRENLAPHEGRIAG